MYYETIFIVNPDVSKENTEALTDGLVKRVEKASGRIVKREYWGSRPLAYQIAKRKRGHYALLVTDGESAAIQALEEGLRLEERVLRFLTTRLQELSDEPSPLLRRQIASAEASKNEDAAAKDATVEDKPTDEPAEKSADKAESKQDTPATKDNADDSASVTDTEKKEVAAEPAKQRQPVEAGGDAAA